MLSATELEAAIAETLDSGDGGLLIDLTHCLFVDSTGLAALVDGDRAIQAEGRAVVIVVRSPGVRRTLALTGVDDLIDVCFSREEAEERLAGRSPQDPP